jgi:hypothetical protein
MNDVGRMQIIVHAIKIIIATWDADGTGPYIDRQAVCLHPEKAWAELEAGGVGGVVHEVKAIYRLMRTVIQEAKADCWDNIYGFGRQSLQPFVECTMDVAAVDGDAEFIDGIVTGRSREHCQSDVLRFTATKDKHT